MAHPDAFSGFKPNPIFPSFIPVDLLLNCDQTWLKI